MDPKEQREEPSNGTDQRETTPQSSDNHSEGRNEPQSDKALSKEKAVQSHGENICEIDATTPPDENSRNEVKHKAEIEEVVHNKVRIEHKKTPIQLSNTGIMATFKKAEDKQKTGGRRKLMVESTDDPLFKENFDDDMPVSTMAQIAEANRFLIDRSHRPDLVLVKNYENEGTLFIGDRPFWQGNCLGDDMPQCERRTISQICRELGANKAQFREFSAIAQTGNRSVFDSFLPKHKMFERNKMYFSAKQVEVNTIVTLIQMMQLDNEAKDSGKEAPPIPKEIKGKKPTRMTRKPQNVGTITEPTVAVSYRKYEIKKRDTVAFNRTGMGVCKKQPKKGQESSDSSSSASSSSKSDKDTTPMVNQHHAPPPSPKMPVARKKATLRRGMSKKNK